MKIPLILMICVASLAAAYGDSLARSHEECVPTEDVSKACFDILKPQKPRAVLVLVPGVNDSGSGFLEETSWKRFVSERSWALVGATFVSPVDILKWNGGYYNPAEESGRMLLDSLSRQGLGRLPIYIYGFSGGARFAARFADAFPSSVAAFATLGMGDIPEPTASKGPNGIVACGAEDPRLGASLSWFKDARSKGWNLTWAEVRGLGHARNSTVEDFVRQWFDEESRRAVRGGVGVTVSNLDGKPADDQTARAISSWFPSKAVSNLWKGRFFARKVERPATKMMSAESLEVRAPARYGDVFSREIRTKVESAPRITLYGIVPDGRQTKRVICLSLIANDVGDIEALLKGENREGVVGEWLRYAEANGFAVLAWAAPSGLWKKDSNWDEYGRKDNRGHSLSFHSVALAWKSAVENVSREHHLPGGRYWMIGFSRAAQFAMRLALHVPSKFAAVAVHVPSSFDTPVPAARGIVWCLTTGENESGYERSLKFVAAAKKSGYPIIYKAYPGLGHSDSMLACELGKAVFDYVVNCPGATIPEYSAWPYVDDCVNQQVEKVAEQSGVPIEFAIRLPSSEVAKEWKKE